MIFLGRWWEKLSRREASSPISLCSRERPFRVPSQQLQGHGRSRGGAVLGGQPGGGRRLGELEGRRGRGGGFQRFRADDSGAGRARQRLAVG
jgi:hypothetical protein